MPSRAAAALNAVKSSCDNECNQEQLSWVVQSRAAARMGAGKSSCNNECSQVVNAVKSSCHTDWSQEQLPLIGVKSSCHTECSQEQPSMGVQSIAAAGMIMECRQEQLLH